MEEVTRSNLKMPSRNRSVLREQALAAWHFQPSNKDNHQHSEAAWILEASRRDMEIITRALERELNSRPSDDGVIIRTSNEKKAAPSTSEVTSSSVSSCDPGSPSHAAQEVSDSMTRGNRTPTAKVWARSCNNQRSIPMMNNFIGKKRWRRRNRAPIAIMRADPTDFQATVEQMTGFAHESSNRAAPSGWKTKAKRPARIGSNRIPSAVLTLHSSSVGLPVAICSSFDIRPNYLNPATIGNSLEEKSVHSTGSAAASSSEFHGN